MANTRLGRDGYPIGDSEGDFDGTFPRGMDRPQLERTPTTSHRRGTTIGKIEKPRPGRDNTPGRGTERRPVPDRYREIGARAARNILDGREYDDDGNTSSQGSLF